MDAVCQRFRLAILAVATSQQSRRSRASSQGSHAAGSAEGPTIASLHAFIAGQGRELAAPVAGYR